MASIPWDLLNAVGRLDQSGQRRIAAAWRHADHGRIKAALRRLPRAELDDLMTSPRATYTMRSLGDDARAAVYTAAVAIAMSARLADRDHEAMLEPWMSTL